MSLSSKLTISSGDEAVGFFLRLEKHNTFQDMDMHRYSCHFRYPSGIQCLQALLDGRAIDDCISLLWQGVD